MEHTDCRETDYVVVDPYGHFFFLLDSIVTDENSSCPHSVFCQLQTLKPSFNYIESEYLILKRHNL